VTINKPVCKFIHHTASHVMLRQYPKVYAMYTHILIACVVHFVNMLKTGLVAAN